VKKSVSKGRDRSQTLAKPASVGITDSLNHRAVMQGIANFEARRYRGDNSWFMQIAVLTLHGRVLRPSLQVVYVVMLDDYYT
jgi:hypothetical protein